VLPNRLAPYHYLPEQYRSGKSASVREVSAWLFARGRMAGHWAPWTSHADAGSGGGGGTVAPIGGAACRGQNRLRCGSTTVVYGNRCQVPIVCVPDVYIVARLHFRWVDRCHSVAAWRERSDAHEAAIVRERRCGAEAAVEVRTGFVASPEVSADRASQGQPHARDQDRLPAHRCRDPVRQRSDAGGDGAGIRGASTLAQGSLWGEDKVALAESPCCTPLQTRDGKIPLLTAPATTASRGLWPITDPRKLQETPEEFTASTTLTPSWPCSTCAPAKSN
jgi:hypothetical protein